MTTRQLIRSARVGTAFAALAVAVPAALVPATPAAAQSSGSTYKPTREVQLSVGEGQMVTLPKTVTNVWTSNPGVADVFVNSPRQINIFGKAFGEATIIATGSNGSVVYGAQVRVSQNLPSINDVIRAAMPNSEVSVMTVGQTAILNGTVASPEDLAFAEQLITRELNPGVDFSQDGAMCKICVLNRLKVATPLQVTLKVRIAEVSRDLLKQIGVNLFSMDPTSGFKFGINQGGGIQLDPTKPFMAGHILAAGTTLGAAGKLFGLDLAGTLDLAEKDGLVTTLAEPNLTALSGETASFLAGGEFPIPVSQSLGSLSIEYKQYGVSLAFTPVVLGDGRISMRVRPEVSELSDAGSIHLNGYDVPALTTRRAETTVELGSGQSFMLAGLLRNNTTSSIDKAPFLGDLPIIGSLFRSTKFRRQETELVIIVTPYLVKPVSNRLALPTDGYRAPTDPERQVLGQSYLGTSGPPATAPAPAPAIGGSAATTASPGFKL
ncbi:MAG TPA: type II and III secretion system protein family protein [Sphingomicrobium sp.]|nr:type II and III secretion system protein family protein [Sphingomicrobium sp.]